MCNILYHVKAICVLIALVAKHSSQSIRHFETCVDSFMLRKDFGSYPTSFCGNLVRWCAALVAVAAVQYETLSGQECLFQINPENCDFIVRASGEKVVDPYYVSIKWNADLVIDSHSLNFVRVAARVELKRLRNWEVCPVDTDRGAFNGPALSSLGPVNLHRVR